MIPWGGMIIVPRSRRWLYWGAWLGLGLFMATEDILRWDSSLTWKITWEVLALNLAQNLAWGTLSLATLRVCRKWPLHDLPPGRHWAAHLLASAVIVPVGLAAIAALAFLLTPPKTGLLSSFLAFAATYGAFQYLVNYWGVVGIHEGLRILERHREEEMEVSRLESQLAHARLQALKMQVNPHFLFNTLNAVAARMHGEPAAADKMLVKLGQLVRRSLEQNPEQEVRLEQELLFMRDYLEIEALRFGSGLVVRFEVPTALLDALVPAFLLQPLLENAIKHGLAGRGGRGTLQVRATQEEARLVLEVQDDGIGPRPAFQATPGMGIGLRNTTQRLEQMFGREQSFELRFPEEGGALARLSLPLRLQSASPLFQQTGSLS